MRVLVTGGAGFIGSHIVEEAVQRGYAVRVLDDLSTGKEANLQHLDAGDVELVRGNIADTEVVQAAMEDCDWVFHQAALVSVPQSILEPERNHQVNVDGAYQVFNAARVAGIKRVVYASSSAIYGDTPDLPCRADARPAPISPYAAAKLIDEIYASTFNQVYGCEFIGLRYFNVYGPRQDPSSPYSGVLSICCDRIANNKTITVFGDGEQTRDFVYVKDVVAANFAAAEMQFQPSQTCFNVASGDSVTLNSVLKSFAKSTGRNVDFEHGPAREGDIKHSAADLSLTKEYMNFAAKWDLESGLSETFNWYVRSS